MQKPFLAALAGQIQTSPPIWLMRQAGRYLPEYRAVRANQPDFISFCLNPEAAAEVTLQPIRRYFFDASIIFADILLIPHGLGQKVWFEAGEGPKLDPIQIDDLSGLSLNRAQDVLAPVSESIRRVKAELPENTAMIGFAGSPWTVATYMIEGAGSKDRFKPRSVAWSDPDRFDALLNLIVDASIDYLAAQVEAGADALKLFDSWAESLPDPLFDRVVIAPTRRIIEGLRSRGIEVPILGFPRGAGPQIKRYAKQTGITGLAIDHGMESRWAHENLPETLTVQGQLDPAVLMAGGTALESEIDRILEIWADRPFIFNLGHGINLATPPDHVTQLIERVRAHGV